MNRAENDKVIHFPAGTRRYSDTIMQVSVPVETHDITQVGPLLKSIDALGIPAEVEVMVTLDAVRIRREAARDKEREAARLPHESSEKPAQVAVFAKIAAYPGRAWRLYHRAREAESRSGRAEITA